MPIILCIALAFAGTAAYAASASDYPRKSIRVLVGIPPGGGIDTVARAVGQVLSERWSQSVIVDNRTGAGGAIAMEVAAQAAPDGYTLLGGSTGTVATATLLKKISFDTRRAYAPVVNAESGITKHQGDVRGGQYANDTPALVRGTVLDWVETQD